MVFFCYSQSAYEEGKGEDLVKNLNDVEPSIKFTFELENNNSLPFQDIFIHKHDSGFPI